MPLIVVDLLLKIALWFFEWLISKNANDAKLLAAFKEFSELARTSNIRTINERAKAEEQLKGANEKWDRLEEAARESAIKNKERGPMI